MVKRGWFKWQTEEQAGYPMSPAKAARNLVPAIRMALGAKSAPTLGNAGSSITNTKTKKARPEPWGGFFLFTEITFVFRTFFSYAYGN